MKIKLGGKEIFYTTGSGHSDSDSELVLFVHGAGFDHSVWVMPSRYFARKGLSVYAVDLPGRGGSEGPPLSSIDLMADCLADFILQLNPGGNPVTVVGHSMGSLVAYSLGARHKDKVSKIALLGTSVPMPVSDVLLNAAEDNDHASIDMTNIWSHSSTGKIGRSENPGANNLLVGQRLLERAGDGVLYSDLRACNEFDVGQMPEMELPCLVIVGEADKMTPASAGISVAENLAKAEVCSLSGCGHAMLSERPNEVLDALSGFILN